MTDRPTAGGSFYQVFLAVACLALAVLVVLLSLQNRELEAELEEARARIAVAEVGQGKDLLGEGDLFPPVELVALDGGAGVSLAFDGGGAPRTMLMLFSVECPACRETIPLWDEVLHAGDRPALDVLAVRLDAHDDGTRHELPRTVPVFDPADGSAMPVERIVIPATFVVDAHGFIEHAWYGVPSDRRLGEMERVLFP